MPQLIDVPGQGVIEFPDDMTPDDISGAIQKSFPDLAPKAAEPSIADKYLIGPAVRGYNRLEQAANVGSMMTGLSTPEEAAANIAANEKDIAAYPVPADIAAGTKEIMDSKTYWDAAKAAFKNPKAISNVFVESIANSLPSVAAGVTGALGGAAVGSAVPVIGTVAGATGGAAAGVGLGSGITEFLGSISEQMDDAKIDKNDDVAVAKALTDPVFMDAAKEKAIKRGVAIGLFDALSAGFAGRIAGPVGKAMGAASIPGKKITGELAEVAMQAGAGGAGEYAAQQWTGEDKPGAVILEMAAEVPPGIGEIAGGRMLKNMGAKKDTPPPPVTQGVTPQVTPPTTMPNARAALNEPAAPGTVASPASPPGNGAAPGGVSPPGAGSPPPAAAPPAVGAQVQFRDPATGEAGTGTVLALDDVELDDGTVIPNITIDMGNGRVKDAALTDLEIGAAQGNGNAGTFTAPDAEVTVAAPGQVETPPAPAPEAQIAPTPPVTPAQPDELAETIAKVRALVADGEAPTPEAPAQADVSRETPAPYTINPDNSVTIDGMTFRGQNNRPFKSQAEAEAFAIARVGGAPPAQPAEPTPAQAEAGNYKKKPVAWNGLNISIETAAGQTRRNKDPNGPKWEVVMPADYGYVKRTEGADGEQVDVYVGPNPESQQVFVVDQIDPKTGKFDEHKVMVGFADEAAARTAYAGGFSDGSGPSRAGAVTPMSVDGLREWLRTGDTKKPVTWKPGKKLPADRRAEKAAKSRAVAPAHTPVKHRAGYGNDALQARILERAQKSLDRKGIKTRLAGGALEVTSPVTAESDVAVADEIQRQIEISAARSATSRERGGPQISVMKLYGILGWIAKRGGMIDTDGIMKEMDLDTWHKGKPGMRKVIRNYGVQADGNLLGRVDSGGRDYSPEGTLTAAIEDGIMMPDATLDDLYEEIRKSAAMKKPRPDPEVDDSEERARERIADFVAESRKRARFTEDMSNDALDRVRNGATIEDAVDGVIEDDAIYGERDLALDAKQDEVGDGWDIPFEIDTRSAQEAGGAATPAGSQAAEADSAAEAAGEAESGGVGGDSKRREVAPPAIDKVSTVDGVKDQIVIPGAEQKSAAEAKAAEKARLKAIEDEKEVLRKNQSMMRRGNQKSVEDQGDGLFASKDEKDGMFAEPKAAAPKVQPLSPSEAEFVARNIKKHGFPVFGEKYVYFSPLRPLWFAFPIKGKSYNADHIGGSQAVDLSRVLVTEEPVPAAQLLSLELFPVTPDARFHALKEAYAATPGAKSGRYELRDPNRMDTGNGISITPSAKESGRFQLTYFDANGFSGDMSEASIDDALMSAMNMGYTIPFPGHLADMMELESFQDRSQQDKSDQAISRGEGDLSASERKEIVDAAKYLGDFAYSTDSILGDDRRAIARLSNELGKSGRDNLLMAKFNISRDVAHTINNELDVRKPQHLRAVDMEDAFAMFPGLRAIVDSAKSAPPTIPADQVALLRILGWDETSIEEATPAERAKAIADGEEAAKNVQVVLGHSNEPGSYFISSGDKNAMYTLMKVQRSNRWVEGGIDGTYIANLAGKQGEAIDKAKFIVAANGGTRLYSNPPQLNARESVGGSGSAGNKLLDRSGSEPLESVSQQPDSIPRPPSEMTDAEAIAQHGLVVSKETAKSGKVYWAVTGNLADNKAVLDAMKFGDPFKMGGKQYRSVRTGDPTAALAAALRGAPLEPVAEIAPAGPTMEPGDAARVLTGAKLKIERDGDKWVVTGKGTFDAKDAIKSAGGKWDGASKKWRFDRDPTEAIAAALNQQKAGYGGNAEGDAGAGVVNDEDARLRELRQREDQRPDERDNARDVGRYVGADTQALIRNGMKFGIPEAVVADQIEDVAMINSAYQNGKPAFILANEAGTGKTFVLGGAIREMRKAGANNFVYVTMNQDLIAQIKRDLAPYGVDDVKFHTYSELSGQGGIVTKDAVLIFDEAHNIKNVGGGTARAEAGQGNMAEAKFTVIASATPFENPVESRYLQATGIFDKVGGFNEWAKAYGAAVKRRKFYNPNTGKQQVEEIIYWVGGKSKKKDAAAARQWFFNQAVMSQRPMRIDPSMVDVQFRRAKVPEQWVDMYDRVSSAYEEAEREFRDEDGNSRDYKITSEIARHRENTIKRILEASKVQFAIDRARERMADGKNVVIFVETKADRELGRFRKSEHFKDPTLYTFPQMQSLMAEWQAAADVARAMEERAPPKPFADFIYEIARAFYDMGISYELPSTADEITKALGAENVAIYTGAVSNTAAAKNKADFLAGKKTVLVATMAKGGTGLSLHDTRGDRPTVQININLPWKATGVDQVSGRVARYGLQSKAEIEWLFASNIAWESTKLAPRVGARMRDMGAVVKGLEIKAAEALDGNFDFEGAIDIKQVAGEGAIDVAAGEDGALGSGDIYDAADRLERTRVKAENTSGGFFATPFPVAAFMQRISGVRPGETVLEPSAGHGNLIRFMPEGVKITAVEQRQDNFETLGKVIGDRADLHNADFMAWAGENPSKQFDVIVMNPPFERLKGVGPQDALHVRTAYDMLAPGGRLVAIMGEGVFFRQFKEETAFREWLDDAGATVIKLPEDTFKRSGTGARARMIVIDKDRPGGRSDISLDDVSAKALRDEEGIVPRRVSDSPAALDRAVTYSPPPTGGEWTSKDIGNATIHTNNKTLLMRLTAARRLNAMVSRIVGPGVTLRVVDRIDTKDGGAAYGAYPRDGDTIYVTLRDLAKMAGTVNHETVHFLRDTGLLPPGKWAILERDAARWREQFKVDEKYAPDIEMWRDDGFSEETIQDLLNEEAVAMASTALGNRTLNATGTKARLLEIIRRFTELLRNIFTGLGPNTARGVLADIQAGRFAGGMAVTRMGADVPGIAFSTAKVRAGAETLKKYGLIPGKKYTNREVATAIEARQREKYGKIDKGDYSDKASATIAKWMVEEIMFEVEQAQANPGRSAVGWYSTKFQKALDDFGAAFPELLGRMDMSLPGVARMKNAENARALFTAIIAITSDGAKVSDNFRFAALVYENFRKTGSINPNVTFGGERNSSMQINLKNISDALAQHGPDKMSKWLLEKRTVSDLKRISKEETGKALATAYKNDQKLPRAALVFGPKLGAFFANLSGDTGYLTMDRWWSRTFNRYRGNLLTSPTEAGLERFKSLVTRDRRLNQPADWMTDDEALALTVDYVKSYKDKGYKDGTEIEKAANTLYKAAFEGLEDQPFNASDREFMINTAVRAQKSLKRRGVTLTIADIQAVLWYYEKRLYGQLGARQSADVSYEEIARSVVASRTANNDGQQRPTDGTGPESGDAGYLDPDAAEARSSGRIADDIAEEEFNADERVIVDPEIQFDRAPPTDSPAFRKWFGDSKVVDAEGKPLVVYHATSGDFEAFSRERLGENTSGNTDDAGAIGTAKLGFWFSEKPVAAKTGDSLEMPVYLALKSPAERDLYSLMDEVRERGWENVQRDMIVAGHDGIRVDDQEFGATTYVVFEPTQIKSVNNRGTWDGSDPRVLFDRAEDEAAALAVANRDIRTIVDTVFRAPKPADSVEVIEEKTADDISWFKRMLYTPEAIFRNLAKSSNPKTAKLGRALYALWQKSVKLETDQSEYLHRLRREVSAVRDSVNEETWQSAWDVLWTGDAEGVEYTPAETAAMVAAGELTADAAKTYHAMRKVFDQMGRFVDQHERKMKPTIRKRKFQLLRMMARNLGIEETEFRGRMAYIGSLRAQLRDGSADPEAMAAKIEQETVRLFGDRVNDARFMELDAELKSIDARLSSTTVRKREGYVPHKFFGTWAVYAKEMNAEGEEVLRLLASEKEGFYADRDAAIRGANAHVGANPGAQVVVRPVQFKFPDSQATEMSDAAYFRFIKNVENQAEVSGQELQDLVQGVARKRYRRRSASFKNFRKGVEGYSRQIDAVMNAHIGEVVRYVVMDELKYEAINTFERNGLSRNRSAITDNPTLAAMVEQWFKDINGQKQTTETQLDELLSKPWARPLNVAMASGAVAFLAGGGITASPAIGLALGGYVGYRMYKGMAGGGNFKTRSITGGMLSDMAHLKLGAFTNVMSAVVNLSQTVMNTWPVLGSKWTAVGIKRYTKAMHDQMLGRDNPDIALLRRGNVSTVFKQSEVSPHLFEGESGLARASMFLFNQAESLNRGVAFLGAYARAEAASATPGAALRDAKSILLRTQFHYGAANKPEILRNVLLRVPLQFKNFMAQQLTFIFGLNKAELGKFLLATFLLAGALGMPGAELLDMLLNFFSGFSPIIEIKRLMAKAMVEGGAIGGMATMLAHGLPALFGIDTSSRTGMGDIFPNEGRDLIGPWASTMMGAAKMGAENASFVDQLRGLSPGLGAPLKSVEAAANGLPITMWPGEAAKAVAGEPSVFNDGEAFLTNPNKRNRLEYKPTTGELASKAIGAMPTRESQLRDLNMVEVYDDRKADVRRARAIDEIVANIKRGDYDAIQEIRAKAFEDGIVIKGSMIKDALKKANTPRLERLINAMPKGDRPEANEAYRAILRQNEGDD